MYSIADAITILTKNGYRVTFETVKASVRRPATDTQEERITEESVIEARAKHRSAGPHFCSKGLLLEKTINSLLDFVRKDAPIDLGTVSE